MNFMESFMEDLAEGFIPEELMLTWESQVSQYIALGPAGISYERARVEDIDIDCLLWRDETGALRGILNYYPNGAPPYESRGNFNMFVDPARRRRGIATALLREADSRWHLDFGQQHYSRAGKAVVQKYVEATA